MASPPVVSPPVATPVPPASSTGPCGTAVTGAPTHYLHVAWIVMENHSATEALADPYAASIAQRCGVATNYSAVAHPSLPNYIALTSGSTQGVMDDAGPAAHPLTVTSIFSQSPSWRSLEESMPGPCQRTDSYPYAVKHNPAAYYQSLPNCGANDVPLAASPDLSAAFTFVTPNLCNDTHDCSSATGDAWLSRTLPALFATPEYRSGSTAIFVTWDEDDRSQNNRVALLVIAPHVAPGTRAGTVFDHYSLLRTTEDMLGLPPLGNAATATSMRQAFGL